MKSRKKNLATFVRVDKSGRRVALWYSRKGGWIVESGNVSVACIPRYIQSKMYQALNGIHASIKVNYGLLLDF